MVQTSDRVDTFPLTPHDFRFLFVMDGDINVNVSDGTTHHLESGDSIALPQAAQAQVTQGATNATLLDVLVPQTAAS
ncbi:MAG: cupin domain-containing protein [Actinomycetota bacterium]|nr:cupin domain-containing protein [Actinomycetota bacterium]